MTKKLLAILLVSVSAPLFADVILQTSISDVFNRGTDELAGSITMSVNDDDFTNASTAEPIYIRVQPDQGSTLAETLVNTALPSTDYRSNPIFLAMELVGPSGSAFNIVANTETTSIVRWVEGERNIWIRVQSDSDTWIEVAGTGALLGPSEDLRVNWTFGVSARRSAEDNDAGKSNLPFNTREAATAGDPEDATSTLLCVDLSDSSLADTGIESLLQYDIIALDSNADIGGGNYSRQAGNDTGINFSNDFRIARGFSRFCEVTPVGFKGQTGAASLLCVPAAIGNAGIDGFVKATNVVSFLIDCDPATVNPPDDIGNLIDTDLFNGSYVTFSTGNRAPYGFLSGAPSATFGSISSEGDFTPNGDGSPVLSGPFSNNGATLFNTVRLFWQGGTQNLNGNTPFNVQVCTYYYFSEPATDIVLDWSITLVNHDGEEDTAPYDGIDQHRRCQPSEFPIYSAVWEFGSYLPCTGVPAVIFFPYVPKLFDSSFWVGLSYVNQGNEDLDVTAISYDEDGNRFTADLGEIATANQHTWLLIDNGSGVVLDGAGDNNAGVQHIFTPTDPTVPAESFGVTRSSLFVSGAFEAEFLDDIFSGDLDGYLLIGSVATGSVDGAYLPRNYDNDIPGQNADLPLRRSKRATAGKNIAITSTQPALFNELGLDLK